MSLPSTAREFLADNIFYVAAGLDDGSAETGALKRAEVVLAEIRPRLMVQIDGEVQRLLTLLDAIKSAAAPFALLSDIGLSCGRIVDVAETLGYAALSRAARSLRQACWAVDADGSASVEILASFPPVLLAARSF